jgi:hypothetical protein
MKIEHPKIIQVFNLNSLQALKYLGRSTTIIKKISSKGNRVEVVINYLAKKVKRSATVHIQKALNGKGIHYPIGFKLIPIEKKLNGFDRVPILRLVKINTAGLF